MKNIQIIILLLLLNGIVYYNSHAQSFTGRITYVSHKAIDLKLDTTKYNKETIQRTQEIFAKQFQENFVLEYNKINSLYTKQDKMNVNGTTSIGNNKLYKDFKSKTYTHKLELLGKVFLVKDSIMHKSWTITNETKTIGKYLCYKATYNRMMNDSINTITSWFTREIPINKGPGIYDGLPGLILQVEEGLYTILCTKIELGTEEINIKNLKEVKL